MKVIFLDIDGVLNTGRSLMANPVCHLDFHTNTDGSHALDPIGVKFLKILTDNFDVKIMVSSTWRLGAAIEELSTALRLPVHDKTPIDNLGGRGGEIDSWLAKSDFHADKDKYCIIDDDIHDMFDHQKPHIVRTNFEEGLTSQSMRDCLDILGIGASDYFEARTKTVP